MAIRPLSENISASQINRTTQAASNSAQRLASGKRLAQGSDDVAGGAVGAQLVSQLFGLRASLGNVSQGSSLLQVANGGVSNVLNLLQQQQALAVQATNGSLSDADRGFLDQQFQGLSNQINQISATTNFNGVSLLAGAQGVSGALAQSNASAAAFTPGTANASSSSDTASTTAIQAFNATNGTSLAGAGAPGQLQFVDTLGAPLANAAFNNVNPAVTGQFSDFSLTNVNFGTSATLSATINGQTFSGTVLNGATTATLTNGSTRIQLGLNPVNLTDAGTASASEATISSNFANTTVLRTTSLQGVDFSNTRLAGVTGNAATGIANARLNDTSNISISNFRYVSNTGAANSSTLAVDINGKTFTANNVRDAVNDTTAARYTFSDGTGQALTLDLTGLSTGAGAIGNIRTNAGDQKQFIDALNAGFAKAGAGLNFDVSGGASLGISLPSTNTANLFQGQNLGIGSATGAQNATAVLAQAIAQATAIQASIGSSQSQFDFAAANIQNSIINQDSARAQLLDTDIASESSNFAKLLVEQKAAIAVKAQSNKLKTNLLKLVQ